MNSKEVARLLENLRKTADPEGGVWSDEDLVVAVEMSRSDHLIETNLQLRARLQIAIRNWLAGQEVELVSGIDANLLAMKATRLVEDYLLATTRAMSNETLLLAIGDRIAARSEDPEDDLEHLLASVRGNAGFAKYY